MSLKPYLWYLVEADGRVRQIQNGVVTSLVQKTPLENAPIGWSDILLKWARNRDRHGQVRTFSLPMGFVKDGAKILRNDAYKFNIDRELYLLIQRLSNSIDSANYFERYLFFYKGQLDFSTYDNHPGDSVVNINIMEGGISKLIKAVEDTEFIIPFDQDAVNVFMEGILLDGSYSWFVPEVNRDGGLNDDGQTFAFIALLPSEIAAPGIAVFSVEDNNAVPLGFAYTADILDYFFTAANFNSGQVTFSGTIVITGSSGAAPQRTHIDVWNVNTNVTTQYDLTDPATHGTPGTYPFSQTITLVDGDRLFFVSNQNYSEWTLKARVKSKSPSTFCKAMSPYNVYKKLCLKAGISENAIISTILQASTYYLTCGDAIRGLTVDTIGIKTTLNNFYKAYNIMLFAGWDIHNTTEIETIYKYYDGSSPIRLGNARDFNDTPATDMIFSSIVIGYQEQVVDDLNGKFDFNGQNFWNTPVKAGGGKKLELIVPYKAGPYEIESIRTRLDGKTTTDGEADNTVFVIDVVQTVRTSYTGIVGFNAALRAMSITSSEGFVTGQKIRISGSLVGNDGEHIITGTGSLFITQLLFLDGAIFDETDVNVTITVVSGAIYNLYRGTIPDPPTFDADGNVITGVPDPSTIFNVRLRPTALFDLWKRWFRSFLYNYEPGDVVFDHANRNSKLSVSGLSDDRNFHIANMGERIFIPWYFNFTTKVPIDLNEALETNPTRCFITTWEGNEYKGFLIEAGLAPNTKQPQTFKLLCAPDTNLLNLIR